MRASIVITIVGHHDSSTKVHNSLSTRKTTTIVTLDARSQSYANSIPGTPNTPTIQCTGHSEPAPNNAPSTGCLYDSVMDDPQLNYNPIIILVTHSVRSTSNI
jgi:hypothetical protein